MFNFKNKTLVLAISFALGLSACGDNAQVAQKEIKKEEPKKLSLSEQVEQKIEDMLSKTSVARALNLDSNIDIEIHKRMFELFPASNTRMEKNAENCRWYVERDLIPAWSPIFTTEEEIKKFWNDAEKEFVTASFLNFEGEPNQKTLALIKEFFFIDGQLFDEDKWNDRGNGQAFLCVLLSNSNHYTYFKNDQTDNAKSVYSGYGYGNTAKSYVKVAVEEFIVNKKTKIKVKDFFVKAGEIEKMLGAKNNAK